MACICSRHDARFDWPIVDDYRPQNQSKKPYNKQIINLER